MSNQLSISNVVEISVQAALTGLGEYNTSNLALFTNDTPANSFGSLGYQIYLSPQQVATDFGTSSETYAMANSVFSQQPNILAGGGSLIVIPFISEIQSLAFSGVPASGSFVLNYGAQSITISYNETDGQIQSAIQGLTGLSQVQTTGSPTSSPLTFSFLGVYNNTTLLTVTSNTLETSGSVPVTVTVTQSRAGETLANAITRTQSLVSYFGIMSTVTNAVIPAGDVLAAAAVVQALNALLFVVSIAESDIESGGVEYLIMQDQFTQTRCLYYGGTFQNALLMVSAYASVGLSVNFTGSDTTITMHLKDLIGVLPDPTMTQTILNLAQIAGADVYASFQNVAKVFTSGANDYYDQVYNLQAFVGYLQVAGFNYLAQSSTKVPQTEQGMNGLKGAYRAVCQQFVGNEYIAPGQWNSSTTFGNQLDFLANISQFGYYIYSVPISQQSQANRAARIAPLVQIAIKEAGAIQESTVVIYVNP